MCVKYVLHYFATLVSYVRKMFMKLTPGIEFKNIFFIYDWQLNKLECKLNVGSIANVNKDKIS